MVWVLFSAVVVWVVEQVMAEDFPVLAAFVVLLVAGAVVAWVSFSPEYCSSSVAGSEASRMRYHSNINIEKICKQYLIGHLYLVTVNLHGDLVIDRTIYSW